MPNPVKRYMNWGPVVFTPVSGSAVTYNGVTSCQVDRGANLMKGAGDVDSGPSTMFVDYQEPSIGIKLENVSGADAVAPGVVGSLSATLNAAPGGSAAGSGARVYVLNPCVCIPKSMSGQYRKFADADVEFHGFFSDGVTNPLTESTL